MVVRIRKDAYAVAAEYRGKIAHVHSMRNLAEGVRLDVSLPHGGGLGTLMPGEYDLYRL